MKKVFASFVIVYGVMLSFYFGLWALKDNAGYEYAVLANKPQLQMNHRVNMLGETLFFLLSNMIVLSGVSLGTQPQKEKESA